MNLDQLLFEPKKLFQKPVTNYVSPEDTKTISMSQLHLQPEELPLRQNFNLKFQSVQNNGELERVIEGIPIPMDDISISSLSNNSFVSVTPQQKLSYNRNFNQTSQVQIQFKHPTPVDSVLTSLNQQQINDWSKSYVKVANGNIFPQVLAPSIDIANDTATAISRPQHTFGSFNMKENASHDKYSQLISSQRSIVEITKYNTQLRTQVLQQQSMINEMMNQMADNQKSQEQVKQQNYSLQQSSEKNQRLKSLVMEMKVDIEDLQEQKKTSEEQVKKLNEMIQDLKKSHQGEILLKDEIIGDLKSQHKNKENKLIQQADADVINLKNKQQKTTHQQQLVGKCEKDIFDGLQNILKQIVLKYKLTWDSFQILSISQFDFALDKLFLTQKKLASKKEEEINDLKKQLEKLDEQNQNSQIIHQNQLQNQGITMKKNLEDLNMKIVSLENQNKKLLFLEESNKRLLILEDSLRVKDDQLEDVENKLLLTISKNNAQQHTITQNEQKLKELQEDNHSRLNKSENKSSFNSICIIDFNQSHNQEQSKNFIEFIQQLLQKIQVYENDITDLKLKLDSKDKGLRSFKSTFISQNMCLKTEDDDEQQDNSLTALKLNPELMSDEETVQLLSQLLSRISKSKQMQKYLRKNQDYQMLLKESTNIHLTREKPSKLTSTERQGGYLQLLQPNKDKTSFLSLQSPKTYTTRNDDNNRQNISMGDENQGFQFSRKTQTMTNLLKKV